MHNDVEERQKQERLLEIAKHAFQAKYHRENVNWFSKTSMKQSYQGYQQASKLVRSILAMLFPLSYRAPMSARRGYCYCSSEGLLPAYDHSSLLVSAWKRLLSRFRAPTEPSC